MASMRTYTFNPELLARFESIVAPGQRSQTLSKLLEEFCDKYDSVAIEKGMHEHWIINSVAPFVKKYADNYKVDPYRLWNDKGILTALKSAGMEVTQEEVRRSIEYLLKED